MISTVEKKLATINTFSVHFSNDNSVVVAAVVNDVSPWAPVVLERDFCDEKKKEVSFQSTCLLTTTSKIVTYKARRSMVPPMLQACMVRPCAFNL